MTKWHVPVQRQLIWREWEGEAVVFNAASSRTHYLNPLAAEALRQLEKTPQTADELTATLSGMVENGDPDRLKRQMHALTEGFARLGLVDPWHD